MDISAARVIAAMTKTEIPYEEETEGKINMCKAIDDLRAQAKEEGRTSGLEEGKMKTLSELVHNGKLSSIDAAQCAGMSPEEFMKMCG